ncbi:MAG: hypothetical protein ACRCT8_16800 [Lacipirellulaceae bacterium]
MNPLEDPPTRASLAMALLALVLVAMLLVGLAMWGARWARRWGGDLRKPLPERPRLRPEHTPPVRFAPTGADAPGRDAADTTVETSSGKTSPGAPS